MINGSIGKKQIAIGAVLAVALIGGIAFAAAQMNDGADDGRLQVTASFYPMAYLAEEVGGDLVSVTNLTPAGAEPHDFEPSARDIARIEDADVLLLNGGVEVWGDQLVSQLQGSSVAVLVANEGLATIEAGDDHAEEEGHEDHDHGDEAHEEHEEEAHDDHDHGPLDPHVWTDPLLYKEQAQRVADTFASADPANADAYRANAAALADRLDALDAEYRAGLSMCASDDIVTTHTAFAYLAERYGLEQLAISGISPDADPTASQIAEVAEFARENEVTHIFFESLVSPDLARTVADEIGAETLVLNPLEGLSPDQISAGADYFSVMRENLANLRTALECS